MAETTVRELADVVGIPINRLLAHLGESGLPHTEADERINDQEKAQLFTHLRRLHSKSGAEPAAPRKITLRRKSVSELRIASPQGRRKTVTVETRGRRVYMPGAGPRADSSVATVTEEGRAKARMDAAKRALQEGGQASSAGTRRDPEGGGGGTGEGRGAAQAARAREEEASSGRGAGIGASARVGPGRDRGGRGDARRHTRCSRRSAEASRHTRTRTDLASTRLEAWRSRRRARARGKARPWPQKPGGAARRKRQGGPQAQEAEIASGGSYPARAPCFRDADRAGRSRGRHPRDHHGGRPCAEDVDQGHRAHQGADGARHDGDHQSGHRSGCCGHRRGGTRSYAQAGQGELHRGRGAPHGRRGRVPGGASVRRW